MSNRRGWCARFWHDRWEGIVETCLLKLSPDGKQRLWSQVLPIGAQAAVTWEGARSIAVDRDEVYLLGHVAPIVFGMFFDPAQKREP